MNQELLAEAEEILAKALFNEMISVHQLHKVISANPLRVVLLDVRTAIEHQEGVIPRSTLFPCDHNLENREDTGPFSHSFHARFRPEAFDPETRYVLICRSGPRTAIALARFLECGLQACELIGGTIEWARFFPLVPAA
ncbi:MAG: hypothetical protein HQL82_03820 [Magnetococcales bacterium]|nr:hypothetical protein [Magnetococcales bacterium]